MKKITISIGLLSIFLLSGCASKVQYWNAPQGKSNMDFIVDKGECQTKASQAYNYNSQQSQGGGLMNNMNNLADTMVQDRYRKLKEEYWLACMYQKGYSISSGK
jgi:uncharacterized protein YceK